MNLISFSGTTEGLFRVVIPKPYVFTFVLLVVAAGMYWINKQEQVCSLLEGERQDSDRKVDASG